MNTNSFFSTVQKSSEELEQDTEKHQQYLLSKEDNFKDLRKFLSQNVVDIRFLTQNYDTQNYDKVQEVSIHDWKKITSLHFQKYDHTFTYKISQTMVNLTQLRLTYCGINEQGARFICKDISRLLSLDLEGNCIRQEGGLAIANNLSGLKKLNLRNNKIGDLATVTISNKLSNLEFLDVSYNRIGNLGAQKIASNLKKLKQLHISWNEITTKGAEKLSSMKQLTHLNIKTNHIEAKGGIVLSRNLPHLVFLQISNNRIGDYGAQIICQNCNKVEQLGLWDNNLTSHSLTTLSKLSQLTWLMLSNNSLTQDDILKMCYSLKKLKHFDVSKIEISENARKRMQQILPQCQFQFS